MSGTMPAWPTIHGMHESLTDVLAEHELAARTSMPKAAFDYFAAGAGDEVTLEESHAVWRRHRIRPRVLRGGAGRDPSIDVLGAHLAIPVVVAPTAYQVLAHPDGEVETARGVSAAGGLMVVTTRATSTLEAIAAELSGPWWYQVYVLREHRLTSELVRRAAGLGASALMLTADTPYIGFKRRGHIPPVDREQHLVNFRTHIHPEMSPDDVALSVDQDPTITFETIGWLREVSGLPVFVKGVLRGDDAALCLDAGAAGVVVSNHGGRQLDRSIAAAAALPEIVAAVEGRAPILVDGGISSGTDVFIALALGATATMVGRPILWGLAAAGSAGVRRVLDGYRNELDHAMGLAGVARIGDISRDFVA